jgi:hypothetical protein
MRAFWFLPFGLAAAILAVPASAGAAVALPAVERTLSTAAPAATYVAPMSGYVTVRTAADAATDWNATLVDAASGRTLARSASFTSNEVLQAWVNAGQRLKVVGTRHAGPATPLRTEFTLFDVAPPARSAAAVKLVSVAYDSLEDLDRLDAAGLDVTHAQNGSRAEVLVSGARQLRLLERLGLSYRVKVADLGARDARALRADAKVAGPSPLPTGRTTYRTFDDYQAELTKLADENPGLVRRITLPKKTVQGRDVQGIEIATNVEATDDGRPTFFLMGVHHAREWPASEAAMEFAHMLVAAKDGSNARLKRVLDNARVLVVPIVNVDGFIASRGSFSPTDTARGELCDDDSCWTSTYETAEAVAPPGGTFAYRRKNCGGALPAGSPCELQYGIDPNRNYGNGWGGKGAGSDPNTQSYRGPGMWSEPESQNVHAVSQDRPVTSLITLHTVGAQINRPPARGSDGLAPDEVQLKALGDAMNKATGWVSQYSFQLYDTSGTTEDWNYAAAGTLGYTIEMGPEGGGFHMPYQTGVVDQWTGKGKYAGKGLREALTLSAEAALDPKAHAILDVTATPGTKLTLRRDFVTKSSPVCSYAQGYINSGGVPPQASAVNCAQPGAVQSQDDHLQYTAAVGPSGALVWHVTQSTRPFVGWKFEAGKRVDLGAREPWKLTATAPDGTVTTQDVFVERGERKALVLP